MIKNINMISRMEDQRLLRGAGCFVADALPADVLHAVFLRAEVASGHLSALDVARARAMPGVIEVVTAVDLAVAGLGPLPQSDLPGDDGGPAIFRPIPLLAGDDIGHLGAPVAMVIAQSDAMARDAAEAIGVDIAEAPAAAGIAAVRCLGEMDRARAAVGGACHQVHLTFEAPRGLALSLEPRGCLAMPDAEGGMVFRSSTQNPYALRKGLAALLGCPIERLRVLSGDVGGSFGLKGFVTREEALVAWSAQRLGRAVTWLETRSESFLADHQARGVTAQVSMGLDADLRIQAIAAEFDVDMGAYPDRRALGMLSNAPGITGLYHVPVAGAVIRGHLSARMPLAPMRGNGRPEATLAIEQLLDRAARQIGCDPVDLRQRNLIQPDQMPYSTPLGFDLDVGDFPRLLAQGVDLADRPGLIKRRQAAMARGKIHGAGLAACVESAAGPVPKPRPDHARITVDRLGQVRVATGVTSTGQGHETAMTRMVCDQLGLPADRVCYVNGDTDATKDGRGSGGSAGIAVAGAALWQALSDLRTEGAEIAAVHFGVAPDAVQFAQGIFTTESRNLSLDMAEIAALRAPDGLWQVDAVFAPSAAVFPNGVHSCEVEIDPETGVVEVTRYRAIEDVGHVWNADLVAGQLHGGIVMGLAQALGEAVHYDADNQLISGSLMDHYLPRAADMPKFGLETLDIATGRNPLGAKGVGEAGTVGALAAAISAVADALAGQGVTQTPLPATPLRVWQALCEAAVGPRA